LARLLHRLGVACQVIAPTLIPTAPGDRITTDSRDCRRLARLHRAGELVAIRVPTVAEEAVRDLCRARADLLADRTRARHRLSKFLLGHGQVFRAGSAWTVAHERWLVSQRFEDPALAATYGHYRAVLEVRDAQLEAIEADLASWYDQPPFADAVARLAAYRGVTRLGALTLASEVADWRRFATAGQFMGFCGLVPSEYSSGTSTWRGHITKTGNAQLRTQLVESAWAYQHRPQATLELRRRQAGLAPETIARAWTAQLRLCGRFRRLQAPQERQIVGGHRGRPGAGRLPVGRDGRLACPPTSSDHPNRSAPG
jgi:transposase